MDLKKEIERLRVSGMGYKAIALALGCSKDTVRKYCKKIGLTEDVIWPNGYKPPHKDIEQVIEKFDKAVPHFEYLDGYENNHSTITVRCKRCGDTFRYHWTTLIYDAPTCRTCAKNAAANRAKKEKENEELLRYFMNAAKRAREEREKQAKNVERFNELYRIRECKNCGEEFTIALSGRQGGVYCSDRCARKYRNKNHERRREDFFEKIDKDLDITLQKLYKRDRGVCGICGGKCDYEDYIVKNGVVVTGDYYPSIDHINPVSKGGSHTWDNIQLAHRVCNSRKGNKTGGLKE